MRGALVLFNLFVLSLQKTIYDIPDTKKFISVCAKEADIDGADFVQNIQDGKFNETIFEQIEYRCFEKCLFVNYGCFDDEGEIEAEPFKAAFGYDDDKKLMEYVEKCSDDNEQKDMCDRVYYRKACLIKNLTTL